MGKNKLNYADERGFTLIEIMVSVFLFAMLALLMGHVFQKGHNLFDVLSAQSQIQRNGRKVMQSVATSLRQARLATVAIPASPSNNQITFGLPLYQTTPGVCSAFASVVDGTSPLSCAVSADCAGVTKCGSAGSMSCVNSICRRNYTYAVSSAAGISQLVVSAPGEADRVVGNRVQSVAFQNNGMDVNLQSNEIRVTMVASSPVISERRTHSLSLASVIQVRN